MMFSKSATAMIFFLLCVCTLLSACTHLRTPASYDLVLKSGRVIDPESGLDAVRHIGIRGGQIAAISTEPLHGAEVIDAVGMVIAPGFLDIHSHSPTLFGARFQALDGVTTQLDLEAGAFPVTAYGDYFELGALLNFGASVSHLAIRTKVLTGKDTPYLFSKAGVPTVPQAFTQRASAIEISAMQALLQEGLDSGGLGIGLLLDYISDAVSPAELRMVFEVAGQRGVPVTVHVRRGLPGDPAGLDEVIALAEATGAQLLICHISHSAMHRVDDWLARIDAANARGARISAETLTYSAGGTAISAAVFDRDWQSTFAITYADVQWTATGEWLTEETFKRYRKEQPGGMINHHYVKEEWLRKALRWPGIMVVSDATPAFSASVLSNPNVSGTFTRLLGHYASNEGILNLNEALARTSLHQARWLEKFAPKFRLKGRIQIGMDADLVVFDPRKIAAQATYGKPYEAPIGMAYVIVAGQPIVRKGELAPSVLAGKRLLAGR